MGHTTGHRLLGVRMGSQSPGATGGCGGEQGEDSQTLRGLLGAVSSDSGRWRTDHVCHHQRWEGVCVVPACVCLCCVSGACVCVCCVLCVSACVCVNCMIHMEISDRLFFHCLHLAQVYASGYGAYGRLGIGGVEGVSTPTLITSLATRGQYVHM